MELAVFEGGTSLREDAVPLFECGVQDAAAGCRCVVPAAALRPGHEYYWYVTPRNAGRPRRLRAGRSRVRGH